MIAERHHALDILRENDRGTYTVPTKGLYPFQWNWDSCLTALGQRHYDEQRAWVEIETLLDHQWPDGMLPHIVFHQDDDGYFPGPAVWNTGRPVPTSGITQPPVLGFVLRRLVENATDQKAARERARPLLKKAAAWHRWFAACRDPLGTGLAAILHPWESGRDNAVDWDAALSSVPTSGVVPYERRDTMHVDAAERPTKAEYDRYLWLVQQFRDLKWDNRRLHDASPFKVVDPGFNAILVRSEEDLAALAGDLGEAGLAEETNGRARVARAAFPSLWSDRAGQFLPYDRAAGRLIDSPSVAGVLPLFAGLGTPEQLAAMAATIERWRNRVAVGVPSHDPADSRFESKRYWRGPVWLIVNYMLADGLIRTGFDEAAAKVVSESLELIRRSGFAEYYDPATGTALGGGRFTWTAAMVLEFLSLSGGNTAEP
jgi:hypothetical protein